MDGDKFEYIYTNSIDILWIFWALNRNTTLTRRYTEIEIGERGSKK